MEKISTIWHRKQYEKGRNCSLQAKRRQWQRQCIAVFSREQHANTRQLNLSITKTEYLSEKVSIRKIFDSHIAVQIYSLQTPRCCLGYVDKISPSKRSSRDNLCSLLDLDH